MERKRARLLGYDYTNDNLYFVTSCVQDRICCFGEIINDAMCLNEFGNIAHEQFIWLNNQYDYVDIHAFVVMPNHVHALIEINRKLVKSDNGIGVKSDDGMVVGDGRDHPLHYPLPIKIKPLSQLIGAYKTTFSKQIHLIGNTEFNWQRTFHDHIIRNESSYENILNYIHDNPKNWKGEKLFQILK